MIPSGHLVSHGCCSQLLKVKVTSGNLVSSTLVHWMHKEMEANKKKVKCSLPWLLLSVIIAKMKLKEHSRLDLDARPSSVLDISVSLSFGHSL